ncbi:hypothetical protein [Aquimarina sp. 2201CG5-10]|uniref:hypothetical protein n=1 Tax=Aquimarina callyspongiae TaxID=3098150 RepID=UPI002AB3F855|nr:hypothetical protein [Aquimarina sp. 2201CG5-10]MDY8138240.1 hypothetical protein [Aquimarina sp. 2201CG5-10]
MKPTLIILFFLNIHISFGQSRKEILVDISNKYQLIRELVDDNTLRQHHIEYTCEESSDKGSLTFYYNSRELKHILHTYTQGHVTFKDEYYIWDDQLFFQFAIHKIRYKDYERKKYGKVEKVNVTLTLEERFYFHEENAIKCQFKDFETRSNKSKNPRTNYVRNQITNCEQAQKVLLKYQVLLQQQELDLANACVLPKSISKILKDDVIYGNMGLN